MYDNFIIHSFNVYIISNINDNKPLYSDVLREVFAYLPTAICDNIKQIIWREKIWSIQRWEWCMLNIMQDVEELETIESPVYVIAGGNVILICK